MTTGPSKYRALFISDCHLGSHHCRAERLYKFLTRNDAERIYLVGDIIEGNLLVEWPPFHNAVLRILFDKAQAGTEVIYIPGNHDRVFRQHIGHYGNLSIAERAFHERAGGEKLLVIHGDETDLFNTDILFWTITKFETITKLHLWELFRRCFRRMIDRHTVSYENKIMAVAQDQGFLGVLCGHIHMPRIVNRETLYLNPGDWVWHCTAIAEDQHGHFKLLHG